MMIAEHAEMAWIDKDTVTRYRRRFDSRNPDHVWSEMDDDEFLLALGAARREGGVLKPTRAGLLMFGLDRWIVQEFPHYLLDYRQETEEDVRWEDRLVSFTGEWTGNVYDFYYRAYAKLRAALKTPFSLSGIERDDDTPAHKALREALANCLTNAHWFERRGVVCVWRRNKIEISNPGDFRMPIEEAMKPGSSDPRNEGLMRMFAMIDIGERAGSGLDKIMQGWVASGYDMPSYNVAYGPDRTTLTLPLTNDARNGSADASGAHLSDNERIAIRIAGSEGRATSRAVSDAAGISRQAASALLKRLVDRSLLEWHGTSARDPRQYYSLR